MEAVSKRTGKIFTGRLAALMIRIGVAIPSEERVPEKPKARKVTRKRSVKNKVKK